MTSRNKEIVVREHECDACHSLTTTEVGELAVGYYLTVDRVLEDKAISANDVFACTTECLAMAVTSSIGTEGVTDDPDVDLTKGILPPRPTPFTRSLGQ